MKNIIGQVIAGIIILIITPWVTHMLGWWPAIIKFGKGLVSFLKKQRIPSRTNYSCMEEVFALFVLTEVDGQLLSLEDIANRIKCSNIRTLHALEKLQERDFVKSVSRAVGDLDVYLYELSSKGREEVIKLNLDKELEKKNENR